MTTVYPVIAFVLPILPVVAALLLFLPGTAGPMLRLAPWLPLTALGLLSLHGQVADLSWLLLEARIGLEAQLLPLFILAVIVWTLAGVHARKNLPDERQAAFFFFWLMAWTGNLCVFITLDAASFYAAYATLTFAAYGLIVHQLRPADFRAGRVYLVMAMIGEGMIIAALLTLGSGFGNVALEHANEAVAMLPQGPWVAMLFALGFGIKMGLVPLHMWLPLAHPQAPVPASAVLSGVIVKAGLVGWLRFLPLGYDSATMVGAVLLAGGVLTTFYGAAAGIAQNRPKTVLAYSTVSQMGLIAILIGLALLYPGQVQVLTAVALVFALHHGLAKASLFMAVDITRIRPALARGLMWLPALAIAGAPLTSGALAKTLMKGAIPATESGWLEPVLLAGSVATTLIMGRFLFLAWPRENKSAPGTVAPWIALVAATVAVTWAGVMMMDPEAALRPFGIDYLVSAATPVVIGIAISLAAARWLRRHRFPAVPEGDLIELLPALPAIRFPTRAERKRFESPATSILEGMESGLGDLAVALLAGLLIVALIFAAAIPGLPA